MSKLENYPSTSITKLRDRYVVLVSGNTEASTFVYKVLEVPLHSPEEVVGRLIRRGLEGNRDLSAVEAERYADEIAANPVMEDFGSWKGKFGRVAVIGGKKEYELKVRLPGSSALKEIQFPIASTDAEFGAAIVRLLDAPTNKRSKSVPKKKKR